MKRHNFKEKINKSAKKKFAFGQVFLFFIQFLQKLGFPTKLGHAFRHFQHSASLKLNKFAHEYSCMVSGNDNKTADIHRKMLENSFDRKVSEQFGHSMRIVRFLDCFVQQIGKTKCTQFNAGNEHQQRTCTMHSFI